MKALIFVNSNKSVDQAFIINGFLDLHHEVDIALINSVTTENYKLYADIVTVKDKVRLYGEVAGDIRHCSIENYDLIWVMNQPHELLAKDVWQLLWMLSRRIPFVNSVESLVFLNNKNNLGLIVPEENLVKTYVGHSFDYLYSKIAEDEQDKEWIVKPTNGGCGADVYYLTPKGENTKVILQSMTGNALATQVIVNDTNLIGIKNKYAVLQEYIPEVKRGEKRVIIAGGKVIGSHGRSLAPDDHRSNITQGGSFFQSELNAEEQRLCDIVAKRLLDVGVGYVGLDISYPYVLEFNMVNPGGIDDIFEWTGVDITKDVIQSIIHAKLDSISLT
ncbi:hypothetical protein P9H28_22350 [Paenibacillus barengoltzii]|uniref:ATP-grasp domain-containing protein n=1 Tax=Paenibacillus barengoltzii TaxID=343517 RepID=UPI002DB7DA77|nr:hypothetical protein [Paenibacillus barengoltzii]MEC2346816.1 hypothetical protein [Paenibacillus barengoltzii]